MYNDNKAQSSVDHSYELSYYSSENKIEEDKKS